MSAHKIRVAAAVALVACFFATAADATMPPKDGVEWSDGYIQRLQQQPDAFTYQRAYMPLMNRIQNNRRAVAQGIMSAAAANAAGGLVVSGTKSIPVLLGKYSNTGADPYPQANLQQELFDGPWPTGTMTEYYQEISYGVFTVTGTVFPWQSLANVDTFYESGCNGLCNGAKTGDFLRETLDLSDVAIDFAQYDNDGPDGVPNSGDDDGFVDFVAFVHPESGGECGNSNMWSHRWVYSGWHGGAVYTTGDARAGGGSIQVDDYVVMPAFACDNATMIEIGVFAHEFGHAFGLPDLYDTNPGNGTSEGIGSWGLMASGSWGGDNQSPETPTHMSAWSKQFLGWLNPTAVAADTDPASLGAVEDNAFAYKIPISPNQYYLVANRQKKLFDSKLKGSGLLVWHIDEAAINAGMPTNSVNADENNKGVDVEEADGKNHLDGAVNRGDGGDVFPGSANRTKFDSTTSPTSSGTTAVCDVGASGEPMTAKIFVSKNTCEDDDDGDSGGPSCSAIAVTPGSGGGGQQLLFVMLLLLPLLVAALLALLGPRRGPVAG